MVRLPGARGWLQAWKRQLPRGVSRGRPSARPARAACQPRQGIALLPCVPFVPFVPFVPGTDMLTTEHGPEATTVRDRGHPISPHDRPPAFLA